MNILLDDLQNEVKVKFIVMIRPDYQISCSFWWNSSLTNHEYDGNQVHFTVAMQPNQARKGNVACTMLGSMV